MSGEWKASIPKEQEKLMIEYFERSHPEKEYAIFNDKLVALGEGFVEDLIEEKPGYWKSALYGKNPRKFIRKGGRR